MKKARHSGPLARCGVFFCVVAAGWYIRISYDLVGFIPLNELMKEETA